MRRPTLRIRVSPSFTGLICSVTPTGHEQLLSVLRPLVPEAARVPGGLFVPAHQAGRLAGLEDDMERSVRWIEPARQFARNRAYATSVHDTLVSELRELREGGRLLADRLLPEGVAEGVLDDHQRVNVAGLTMPGAPGLCLFDEQGAGKTVSCIFAFDLLVDRGEADRALVVAPKSMLSEWGKDFERFTHDLYEVRVVAGSRKEKLDALRSRASVLVTNFETTVTLQEELAALLRREGSRTVLVVDESFHVKSPDAQRTRALRALREYCSRAWVLCGTHAPNSASDVVEQFNLVDFGQAFARWTSPDDDHVAARDAVARRIERSGLFLRHVKAQVLPHLPPKHFHRVAVEMSNSQRRLYDGMAAGLANDLRNVSDAEYDRNRVSFLTRRARLLQICSNPAAVDPSHSGQPAKIEALDELLTELVVRRNEKVVVWSFYTASVDAITARYQDLGTVRYDGTITDVAERREAVRRFQEDAGTRVFVANPAAAGAGLTLHAARVAVYESFSNQAAHYLQSLDRVHRRGQTRDVEYYVLLCHNSLEEVEYQRLLRKEREARELLGDPKEQPWTRRAMLAEIIADLQGDRDDPGAPSA